MKGPAKSKDIWKLLYPVPLLLFLLAWHLYTAGDPHRQFIFSGPVQVANAIAHALVTGDLLRNAGVTIAEAVVGFMLGTICGAFVGLSLWSSKLVANITKPYIAALGAVPIFALAPMIISWFGIGIVSKIALAFISTFVLAIVQSYEGAMSVEPRFLSLMKVMGASRLQTFRLVVLPSSLIWVINAMKLNIGLALMGAFIGEFISSEQGLGYMIVRASGLYDMATVLAGVAALIVIALTLTWLIDQLERKLLSWRTV